MPVQTHEFMAIVLEDQKDGKVLVEMRNRFSIGEDIEVLSPTDSFNKIILFLLSDFISCELFTLPAKVPAAAELPGRTAVGCR